MQKSSSRGVAAVERALSILDAFLGGGPSRTLAELAKATGLVKPTVLRSLVSLERCGYVVRLADGRYQLGAKVMQLGRTYRANFKLEGHVPPVLRQLADATSETASFNVRERDRRLCLFRVESSQVVRDFVDPAASLPIDKTATGCVLALVGKAAGSLDERPVFSTAGIHDRQSASISTPVFGLDGHIVGALTVSGPIERFNSLQRKKSAARLVAAADRLSQVLGAADAVRGLSVRYRSPRSAPESRD
jgi:DNA-binding IclR family transcriptional regulator